MDEVRAPDRTGRGHASMVSGSGDPPVAPLTVSHARRRAAPGLISIGTVVAAAGSALMIWAAVTVRRLRVVRRLTGTDPG